MRFAVSLSRIGEVGGEVAHEGGRLDIAIWATEAGSGAALKENLAELADALAARGLEAAIRVRARPPEDAPSHAEHHYLDART